MKYLSVKEETLKEHGAVSEETAREMAEGVLKTSGADIGVGITGLAGPGGETGTKKPGLVYIGVCRGGHTEVKKYDLKGNREKIREVSVCRALTMIRKALAD